jgi:hypothetical protein
VAGLAAVVIVAAAAWFFLIRDDDSDDSGSSGGVNQARIVDEDGLREFAGSVGHEVYWAGPQDDAEIELTNTEDGSVFVRYLTGDAEAGDPRPDFLTIGTYPVPDAFEALDEAAQGDRFERLELDDGAFAMYDSEFPASVHFAYPDTNFEVEVYDPQAGRALELVNEGEIELVN